VIGFSKIELKIIEIFVVLLSGLLGAWLCMEKYFILGISICIGGISLVIANRLYRWRKSVRVISAKQETQKKPLPQKPSPKTKEYILRLTALKNYIMQLQNHSSGFRPKVVKNSNDFWGRIFTLSQNRYDTNIHKNDILSKYNGLKTDIKHEYPWIFKDLSKNPTYEIVVHEINCLLNIFNSMQRPEKQE
jgi:hypothetical protein